MQKVFSLVLVVTALALSGCSSGTTSFSTAVGSVETNSSDIGRFTAWAAVEQKKVEAVQAIETPVAPAESQVKVVLDTEDKIRAWTQYQTTVALKDAVGEMARALRPRSKALDPTPMPKGAFAEGADSVGTAVVNLAGSPGAVVAGAGHFIGSVAKGAVSGNKITATEGSTVNLHQASAKGTSSASIDASTTTTTSESLVDSSVTGSNNPVTTSTSTDSSGSNNPNTSTTTTSTDSSGSNNPNTSTTTTTDTNTTTTTISPDNSVTNSGNASTTTTTPAVQ